MNGSMRGLKPIARKVEPVQPTNGQTNGVVAKIVGRFFEQGVIRPLARQGKLTSQAQLTQLRNPETQLMAIKGSETLQAGFWKWVSAQNGEIRKEDLAQLRAALANGAAASKDFKLLQKVPKPEEAEKVELSKEFLDELQGVRERLEENLEKLVKELDTAELKKKVKAELAPTLNKRLDMFRDFVRRLHMKGPYAERYTGASVEQLRKAAEQFEADVVDGKHLTKESPSYTQLIHPYMWDTVTIAYVKRLVRKLDGIFDSAVEKSRRETEAFGKIREALLDGLPEYTARFVEGAFNNSLNLPT